MKNQTLEECSKVVGLSRERIRQIESKTFRKMKVTAINLGYGKRVNSGNYRDYVAGQVRQKWFGLKQSGKDLLED